MGALADAKKAALTSLDHAHAALMAMKEAIESIEVPADAADAAAAADAAEAGAAAEAAAAEQSAAE